MIATDVVPARARGEFFEWVKFRSHLSRGVTVGTMLQDEAFHFLRIGTFLERADNTARLLDVKFHGRERLFGIGPGAAAARLRTAWPGRAQSQSQSQSQTGGGSQAQSQSQSQESRKDVEFDFYHWSAILRSVSGFEVYRKVYRNVIRPEKVAELLILRPDMPRSLAACMNEVVSNLQLVANEQSKRHPAPRRPPARRPAVRPHRRDPRHRPARVPDAVPRARQRARRRHQPRLPRPGRALIARGRQSAAPFRKPACRSTSRSTTSPTTATTGRSTSARRSCGCARRRTARTPHPQLLAAGRAGQALHQLAAGPAVELPRAAGLPREDDELPRRGRSGRRDGGLQPVRLLPRAERREVSRSPTSPSCAHELAPYLRKAPATPLFAGLPRRASTRSDAADDRLPGRAQPAAAAGHRAT